MAFERDGIACVVIWASGTDTALDGIVRIAAIRGGADGTWEALEHTCAPFGSDEGATARIRQTFGVSSTELLGAPHARDVWPEFRSFIGDRPVLTNGSDVFDAWAKALDAECDTGPTPPPVTPRGLPLTLGLEEFGALLEPGQLSTLRSDRLVEALIDSKVAPTPDAAVHPPHLLAAAAELVARFGDLGPAAHALAVFGWTNAYAAFLATDDLAAKRLAFALALADRPSAWGGDVKAFAPARLEDGFLSAGAGDPIDEDDPLSILAPAVMEALIQIEADPQLPPDTEEEAPFLHEDFAVLDDLFKIHLPALFAPKNAGLSRTDLYRKSQHRVAEEVARSLGSDELLLVHAPTGTGKTLAYILPALMWAKRYGVRVGVATYTRALQSQAMEREVPRALEALGRAGLTGGFRVSILKGREHSLCWRALRAHTPTETDEAETWIAWTALSLFGLRDIDGDLDRFPRRAPIRLTSTTGYRIQLQTLLAQAKARSGCCSQAEDRRTCAAAVARARAERSHLVLTNQSFALARPEFFRRMIFDECEHLHDQAMSAWSHRVSFGMARKVLNRLHEPKSESTDGGGRMGRRNSRNKPPLDRLQTQVLPGSAPYERLTAARNLWSMASSALAQLESGVLEYERWRSQAQLGRADSEMYGLFREYVTKSGLADKLVTARVTLSSAMKRLENSLAQLMEEIEGIQLKRRARLRRSLEMARVDLADVGEAIEKWLPIDEDVPRFANSVFHDVERNVREEAILAALVLLPGEALGRHYYPELGSAAFVSATTRLGGSFDKAKSYLGLDRVAGIDEESGELDRTAGTRRVTTFHAPEVFDYGRVLVGVPRSVPSVQNREAYLDFLGRYLPWYAERTRGRMLVLFTSLRDIREVAERCSARFKSRGLPLFWQGMPSAGKEELSPLFRERVESTLFGVDTFWYGADFPGETLETLCIARLPYGVPDRYHHAQCAAIGIGAQRNRIYMPRALAKFRQGFGRLMRTATDRGVVLVLDNRITDRRHADFLKELPVERPGSFNAERSARLVRGDLDLVGREALAHLGLLADTERRGLSPFFTGQEPRQPDPSGGAMKAAGRDLPLGAMFDTPGPIEIDPKDLPY